MAENAQVQTPPPRITILIPLSAQVCLSGIELPLSAKMHISWEIDDVNTVGALKDRLRTNGYLLNEQHLVVGGKNLDDSSTLAECGIVDGTHMRLV
jgi:hypothetical protein